MDIKVKDYVLYEGRVLVVSYVDEYGIFAEDVDRDESVLIFPSEFDKVKPY